MTGLDVKYKQRQLREAEKHAREVGYSDGYAHKPARSVGAHYQAGWRRGYQARADFENGGAA